MMGRTSVRSSTKRNQAASPPKPSRASQSPRRTRTTRSQSKDLGESDGDPKRQSRRGRGTRADSEDSVSSVGRRTSKASSRGGRTKKATRGAVNRDLSIVAEDRQEIEEEGDDEDEDDNADNLKPSKAHRSQSPGAMSSMSGTTAITSQSAITSHSARAMAELDPPQMAKILPELLESSVKILNLLAPAGATHEIVATIVNELKAPGSRRAKSLRYEEARFMPSREYYGISNAYITSSFVLRKLLGNDYDEGAFRPDAIIHAANLAVLVKEFAVTPKESQAVNTLLSDMDILFPEPFVHGFDDTLQYGSSALVDESFALGLDIRAQWTIYNLHKMQGQEDSQLEDLLVNDFFEEAAEGNSNLSTIDDFLQHGRPKNILRGGPANSEDQNAQVIEYVTRIYAAFYESNDAAEQDDLVDFDLLDEQFGWSDFLADLVVWSRARLNEIFSSINQQGGIQTITKALIDIMNNNDSQLDATYEDPPTIMRTQLPLDIIPSVPRKSLYEGKDAIRRLKKMKKSMSLGDPSSNQKSTAPSSSHPTTPKPIEVYLKSWKKDRNDKNKENRPLDESTKLPAKRRLVDPHPEARRMQWEDDSQEANDGPSNRKRTHEEAEEESEPEESEDNGFEQDYRVPDPTRRVVPPPEPASKRHRNTAPGEDEAASHGSRERTTGLSQGQPGGKAKRPASRIGIETRAAKVEDYDEFIEEEHEEEEERPLLSQVASYAKLNTQKQKLATARTQKRTPWSEADSLELVNLITEHGCSWAFIQKYGEFEVDRDQVAIKDKARNMRVQFEKAQIQLPENFEKIALGVKEIRSIRNTLPGFQYERE